MPTAPDVDLIAESPEFGDAAAQLAERLGRSREEVLREATRDLQSLRTTHDPRAVKAFRSLGNWFMRAYELDLDEDALDRLVELDHQSTLAWLPSHHSYLDAFVLPQVLDHRTFKPTVSLGGINMSFWPFGSLVRRLGWAFIRRSSHDPNYAATHPQFGGSDDPAYRLAVRHFVAGLIGGRNNIAWSIEGGRTRTGKLRQPQYGLMRYVVDAAESRDGPEVMLVPIAIVFDQLRELSTLTAEARGEPKPVESVRWFVRLFRQQRGNLGKVYVRIGEPVPLRERLAALAAEPDGGAHSVERLAVEVCHNLNNATPVTPTAIVALALLGTDRALTSSELTDAIEPLRRYFAQRGHPVIGEGDAESSRLIQTAVEELVSSGVVTRFDGGDAPVLSLAPDQYLIAAFYRNAAIHFLVPRAIAEVVLLRTEHDNVSDPLEASWQEALRLRDLLKFEFFFPPSRVFADDLRVEMALIDERFSDESALAVDPARARGWLEMARPHVAHLVLRPFLDAYLVVAECLCGVPAQEAINEDQFLKKCLGLGHQWLLQRRLTSADSVSLELFRSGLRLARHRGLLDGDVSDVGERRNQFVAELRETLGLIAELERRARVTQVAS